ncbi:uncharacterized protein LOC143431280 isoform X2 [Xylocopa sonorina]|uniref:uncharacterized protein LOC143431280 isoform X2 n=1 Tax=Xylocopa sonorina TaxID=1818115 RepID=UPI00403B28F6
MAGKMQYKMIFLLEFLFCLILILCGKTSMGKPLTPEDVEDLLPPTPHDKNETMAAVVQDPVIQDAVHLAAENTSLNGLVVKKHVFIMPAANPNMVISKREHLLVVPTENLEDVRKNITETKQTEAQEDSSKDAEAFFEKDESTYASEENESPSEGNKDEFFPESNVAQSTASSNEKRKSPTEFLQDTLSHKITLPEDPSTKKVPVPIVAVIDPTKTEKGEVKSPIVAILPNQFNGDALNNQVQFLKDNSDKIQKKAQNYIDQNTLTVDPDYWRFSTPSEITNALTPTQESASISLYQDHQVPSMGTEEMFLTPVMLPQWQMFAATVQNEQADVSRETDPATTNIKYEAD